MVRNENKENIESTKNQLEQFINFNEKFEEPKSVQLDTESSYSGSSSSNSSSSDSDDSSSSDDDSGPHNGCNAECNESYSDSQKIEKSQQTASTRTKECILPVMNNDIDNGGVLVVRDNRLDLNYDYIDDMSDTEECDLEEEDEYCKKDKNDNDIATIMASHVFTSQEIEEFISGSKTDS